MPARLAAMPSTPLAAGACEVAGAFCVGVEMAERVIERLTAAMVRWLILGTTGLGLGLGLGLTTPVKPMFPKVSGASGAWAATGIATAAAWAMGAAALTSVVTGAAVAGSC